MIIRFMAKPNFVSGLTEINIALPRLSVRCTCEGWATVVVVVLRICSTRVSGTKYSAASPVLRLLTGELITLRRSRPRSVTIHY